MRRREISERRRQRIEANGFVEQTDRRRGLANLQEIDANP